jgi:hypothetical protein
MNRLICGNFEKYGDKHKKQNESMWALGLGMHITIPFKSVLKKMEFHSDEFPDESLFCNISSFLQLLRIERTRSTLAKRNFLLLLADITAFPGRDHPETVKEVITCICLSVRETDMTGWYDEGHIIGVIFTEIDYLNNEIINKVIQKIRNKFQQKFGPDRSSKIKFMPLVFPEASEAIIDSGRRIKTLSGLLPICASCKKIRNDEGYWEQIEGYIGDHSDAEFSHGLCPECAQKLYPELYEVK